MMPIILASALGDGIAAATLVLGLIALAVAALTVRDARRSGQESQAAHDEAMEKQQDLMTASALTYREEMTERLETMLAARALQRLTQLGSIADLLSEIARTANDEAQARGEDKHDSEEPLPAPPHSQVITLLRQLEVTVRIYESLGGGAQDRLRDFARLSQLLGVRRFTIQSQAESCLAELEELAEAERTELMTTFDLAVRRYEALADQN